MLSVHAIAYVVYDISCFSNQIFADEEVIPVFTWCKMDGRDAVWIYWLEKKSILRIGLIKSVEDLSEL